MPRSRAETDAKTSVDGAGLWLRKIGKTLESPNDIEEGSVITAEDSR
jgi:hypothetical protein